MIARVFEELTLVVRVTVLVFEAVTVVVTVYVTVFEAMTLVLIGNGLIRFFPLHFPKLTVLPICRYRQQCSVIFIIKDKSFTSHISKSVQLSTVPDLGLWRPLGNNVIEKSSTSYEHINLKLKFRQYAAIHTNYSLSNCTISN